VSETFKILRDSETVENFIKYLNDNKNDIKDIVCFIRNREGKLQSYLEDVPFETLCVISKLIDFEIFSLQLPALLDEDDDDEMDEVE